MPLRLAHPHEIGLVKCNGQWWQSIQNQDPFISTHEWPHLQYKTHILWRTRLLNLNELQMVENMLVMCDVGFMNINGHLTLQCMFSRVPEQGQHQYKSTPQRKAWVSSKPSSILGSPKPCKPVLPPHHDLHCHFLSVKAWRESKCRTTASVCPLFCKASQIYPTDFPTCPKEWMRW